MKKSSKPTKTPAPAKKSKPVARKAQAAPAVKKTAPKALTTTLSAQFDVGFGNLLYIRGEGPGLSWEKGVVMECVADDRWSLIVQEAARPIVFKFLVNDETWSAGDDYSTKPGVHVLHLPTF